MGLQSGITVSTLSGSFADGADPVLGGTFTADIEYWLSDRWVIAADAGLVQRGAGNLTVDDATVDYRMNYLEVPLTVGRTFPLFRGWYVAPYAGVAVAWLSSCGVRFEGQWRYMGCDDTNPGGAASAVDISAPVGVGLRHRYPGGSRIALELRYSRSFSSVLNPGDESARSHLFQAVFGFVLPLSRVDR